MGRHYTPTSKLTSIIIAIKKEILQFYITCVKSTTHAQRKRKLSSLLACIDTKRNHYLAFRLKEFKKKLKNSPRDYPILVERSTGYLPRFYLNVRTDLTVFYVFFF